MKQIVRLRTQVVMRPIVIFCKNVQNEIKIPPTIPNRRRWNEQVTHKKNATDIPRA